MDNRNPSLETPVWVAQILEDFESKPFFYEHEVSSAIFPVLKANDQSAPEAIKAAQAESWAFNFMLLEVGKKSPWGTTFGPVIQTPSGGCAPDIKQVDTSILDYWQRRMAVARHPLLRARYADLVWDLSKAVGTRPPIDAARTAVDAYAALGSVATDAEMPEIIDRMARGLQIALQISDAQRVNAVRDALFAVVETFPSTYAWAVLCNTLAQFPKVELSDEQRGRIIAGLEQHITEMEGREQGAEPAETLHVAQRLAALHRKAGSVVNAQRVILTSGKAVERKATATNAMVASAWLSELHLLYRMHGLTDDAKRVLLAARERGLQAEQQLSTLTVSGDIDPKAVEEYIEAKTTGGLTSTLQLLVRDYIPDLSRLREQIEVHKKQFPLATMFGAAQVSEGQVVGRFGSADEDPDGALVQAIADSMSHASFFLGRVIDRTRDKYQMDVEAIMALLAETPLFSPSFHSLIVQGLEAYLQSDHVKAIHVLVPRIEGALRMLLRLLGEPSNRLRRENSSVTMEKNLNDILEREPVIQETLGEAVVLYLRTFLVDARGYNVRNLVSHGLLPAHQFNRFLSDRVLHILLLLGMVRPKDQELTPGESPSEAQ